MGERLVGTIKTRRIAVAIPAQNESNYILACLRSLDALHLDARVRSLNVLVLANNCVDDTAALARRFAPHGPMSVIVEEAALEPSRANAGWARRLAFDAAARRLRRPSDLLLCTDADTRVARDWLTRTLDYLDEGYDAVAGFARLDPRELRVMDMPCRRRLSSIRRYLDAVDYLKGRRLDDEPWPRHFYEGGASMALTLGAYRRIGGAPTPPVSEDKALFERLRAAGCRIRHPKDVRVLTSCRLEGRAPGGAADTLADWSGRETGDRLTGLSPLEAALSATAANDDVLTFSMLASETEKARRLVRAARGERRTPYAQPLKSGA
jgi:cellulose synthase/poly-beta-1,6-N-acetylglucosamine synthase-like glycosyltransferase